MFDLNERELPKWNWSSTEKFFPRSKAYKAMLAEEMLVKDGAIKPAPFMVAVWLATH